jgi:predicted pyridoxine 5'-phosphate oxidase superfamily flavin-nucleotide-binding protein
MIPQKLHDILEHEGVVAIATQGADGPHLVNTWNSYVRLDSDTLLIPVGGMKQTEANLALDDRVLVTVGAREVTGLIGPGAGFLLTGSGRILTSGPRHDLIRQDFDWARGVLEIEVSSAEQTI